MTWRERTRNYEPAAYLVCLAITAASLTLSPFMMGASQFFLMAVWLFTGDPIKVKLQRFIHNRIAVVLVTLYLLHLVGLIYTSDFTYALKDLRVKLPLLILPIVLSSVKPLSKKHFDLLMLLYVVSVFVATCISFGYYLKNDYGDIREISHFISHIRFCLNIVLAMGVIVYYIFEQRITKGKVVPAFSTKTALNLYLMWFLLFWFVAQIYLFESLSGYLAFAGLVVASLLYLYFTKVRSTAWKVMGLAVVIAIPMIAGLLLYRTVDRMLRVEPVDISALDKKTAQGNDYWHDTVCFPVEDGHYIGLYFCRPEMRETWNHRSELDYDGLTKNGENLEATLARYLTYVKTLLVLTPCRTMTCAMWKTASPTTTTMSIPASRPDFRKPPSNTTNTAATTTPTEAPYLNASNTPGLRFI